MKQEERNLQTKRLLADTLKNLMKQKPLSKITISEIIRDCNVNRKTFYYHFEDIYALVKWMFEEEAIEVFGQFDLLTNYKEAIHFVLDYIEQNDHIISCLYDSVGRDELKRFFYHDFISLTSSLIEKIEQECGKSLDPDYKQFLCNFYTEGITGMLIDWVKEPGNRDREKIIQYMFDTFRGSILGILERSSPEIAKSPFTPN
ncbi:MAG: TetR/AcrR family transcriptional regulator C-terminal domain-containing protein [Lachnospiraceae bacterium]